MEAYSPSSNYRIPEDCLGSSKKRKHDNADSQGGSRDQHCAKPTSGEEKFNKLSTERFSHDLRVQVAAQSPWSAFDAQLSTESLVYCLVIEVILNIFIFS